MPKVEKTVPDTMDGERLDKVIVALVEGASRARVKKAIEAGGVKVNGRQVSEAALKPGDEIVLGLERLTFEVE